MPNKTRKIPPNWGVQVFLNDAHHDDRGYVKGRISWRDWKSEPDLYLDVADCHRVVTLDFGPYSLSRKSKADRIRKLRRLQKVIDSFVAKAIEAIETAEPRQVEKDDDPA